MVATNGCFDILHVGHVRYLAAARKLGDVLVVGLNGDNSVCQLKGEGRPVNREQDRAEVLAALESVDYVTIFPELRATNFLRAAQPAIYAKGGDYTRRYAGSRRTRGFGRNSEPELRSFRSRKVTQPRSC